MNQAILKRIQALESSQAIKTARHIVLDGHNFHIPNSNPNIKYEPSPTGSAFHSTDKLVRLIIGPYGSGKSSMCCAEIVRRACEMPAWCNGIRRSKWAIIRNTTGELTSTTLQTWLHWFGELGDIIKRQKPILTYEHTFNDGNGIVEIELMFLALDREDDLRKVRSLEVTGVYINELSEVPRGTIMHMIGRRGRYPAMDACPKYWSGIIADTNPPDKDHWIYKMFEEERPETYKVFHQPPGLIKNDKGKYIRNMDAENITHLKEDYYTSMAEGQNEEFVKVFCLGQYGSVIMGKRVYPEYNDDFHSNEEVQILRAYPYHIGWDFGLTPACVFVQFTDRGQLRIFKEFIAEDMGIRQFAEQIVLPYIKSELNGIKLGYSIGDPAGNIRAQTDERTCLEILTELGIPTEGAITNAIVSRIESVKYFLTRLTDGFAALLVCRKGAPVTRKGFLGDYHHRRLAVVGEERYQETPNKNKASHPHDACQYISSKFCEYELREKKLKQNENIYKSVTNPAFRYL